MPAWLLEMIGPVSRRGWQNASGSADGLQARTRLGDSKRTALGIAVMHIRTMTSPTDISVRRHPAGRLT
jgi:hypothetical protein